MAVYAIIKNQIVENLIVIDDPSTYPIDGEYQLVVTDLAGIGWRYEQGVFIPPYTLDNVVDASQSTDD